MINFSNSPLYLFYIFLVLLLSYMILFGLVFLFYKGEN